MLDVLIILCVSYLTLSGNTRLAEKTFNKAYFKRSFDYLFFYHLLFCLIFTVYILQIGGDSFSYWQLNKDQSGVSSDNWLDYFGTGTLFIQFLNFIPVRILGLSYYTGNFLYAVLGFAGIRYLYFMFIQQLHINFKIFGFWVIPFVFFLPNLHFWTAGVGKDTLCFFAIAWFLFCFHEKKRVIGLVLSFLLVFYIRPHIAFIMLAGGFFSVILSGNIKPLWKLSFSILVLGVFLLIYQKLLFFLHVEELSTTSIGNLAKAKIIDLNTPAVGSAVALQNYSFPLRLFTYLYRPLFFDAGNIPGFFSSLENLFYLFVSIKGIGCFNFKLIKNLAYWVKAGLCMFLFSTVVFANSLSNLGIALRMKNMFMIYFIFVLLLLIDYKQVKKKAMAGRIKKIRIKKRISF